MGDTSKTRTREQRTWHRQPDEPTLWFGRFKTWLHMDRPRSVLAIYNDERAKKGKSEVTYMPGAWSRAVERYQWRERAKDFDDYQQEQDDIKWANRRAEQKEREWDIAGKLYERARTMLTMPVVKQLVDDGKTIIEAAPPAYHRTAATLLKEARENARMASGMATAREEVSLTKMTDADLLKAYAQLMAEDEDEDNDLDVDDDDDLDPLDADVSSEPTQGRTSSPLQGGDQTTRPDATSAA